MANPDPAEAIAQLVEEAYRGDLSDAVRAALRRTEGAYALVVMHRGEISRLVGARQNVPLVVGLNGEGKTNLLEALGWFALGRSHMGARPEELIAFGQDALHGVGVLGRGDQEGAAV